MINETKYGQTSQAFATTLFQSIMDFESTLSNIEASCSIITHDPSRSISLLNFRNTLDSSLQSFKAIHDIAVDVPYLEGNPRSISTFLIATLYDRALVLQSSGQAAMHDALLYFLKKTLIPYGNMMDDWIFNGSLYGDKAREFYVSRRDGVSIKDSNFWVQGFAMEPVTLDFTCFPCPLFDKSLMSRVFFTGKAVNLSRQIEKKSQVSSSLLSEVIICINISCFRSTLDIPIGHKPHFKACCRNSST